MAGPTIRWTLDTYNSLIDQLNTAGNTSTTGNTCLNNLWETLDTVTSPRRISIKDMEHLKAGALTLDNTLDFEAANAVNWAHDDLYSQTVNATEWKQCDVQSQLDYASATIPPCTDTEYFPVDVLDNTLTGPIFEAIDARDDAVAVPPLAINN